MHAGLYTRGLIQDPEAKTRKIDPAERLTLVFHVVLHCRLDTVNWENVSEHPQALRLAVNNCALLSGAYS